MTPGIKDSATNPPVALTRLRDALQAMAPALRAKVESEIEDRGANYHILHFRASDRTCVIEAEAERSVHAAFLWDNHPLIAGHFEDLTRVADLLECWVADRAMPSEMRRQFPSLEIDPLADYYERGVTLEGEFVRSWDALEEFYREESTDHFAPVRAFLQALRAAGYDHLLRAGQSMSILGLSRSRRQGLREGQPRLWFEFNGAEMDVDANFAPGGLNRHPIRLTPEVRRLLDTLAAEAIA
jgi:hypothetical protein